MIAKGYFLDRPGGRIQKHIGLEDQPVALAGLPHLVGFGPIHLEQFVGGFLPQIEEAVAALDAPAFTPEELRSIDALLAAA